MDTLPRYAPDGKTLLKRCSRCPDPEENKWHPATTEFFNRNKNGKYGLKSICKSCQSKQTKAYHKEHPEVRQQYYAEHREEKLQYHRQYNAGHREEKKQYNTAYQKEHHEAIRLQKVTRYRENREEFRRINAENYRKHAKDRRQYAARYRTEHPEQIRRYCETHREEHRLYDKRYHIEHRTQKKISSTLYRQTHREELKALQKRYAQTEHGRAMHRAATHRRKALKRAIAGTYTASQIAEQLKRQHYRCYYAACGFAKFKKVNGKYLYEIEHTFPLSRVVGTDIPANDMSYLVLACPSCNSKKRDKFPHEWPEGGRLL